MKFLLFLFSVIACCAAKDILPDGPVDAVLGKRVTLETLVNLKDGFIAIIWSFNGGSELVPVITVTSAGDKVSPGYEGKVSLNKTNAFLTLGPLEAKDSGDYIVNIVTGGGVSLAGETRLRVLEPVSAVTIKSNMPEAIEYNSTVVLTCSAKGSFLKFTWTKGTTPIVKTDRITLKEEETSSMLTIKGVLRSDLNAPIHCSAANKLETEKSAPVSITVHYGPDKISISPLNPPKFMKSGSDLKLSCSAESSPAATFSWYHNEAPLAAKGPELTLSGMKENQGGNYSCYALNAKTLRTNPSAVVSFTVQGE